MSLPTVYDINGVLEILPLSRNRIYQLLETGELAGVKSGNKWLITETAIAEYLGLGTGNGTEPESGAADESTNVTALAWEVNS